MRTATHPADSAQNLVLAPVEDVIARTGTVCKACAVKSHCLNFGAGLSSPPQITPNAGMYECTDGVWITIEQYVGWHQKEGGA